MAILVSEREDFEYEIKQAGRYVSDFELLEGPEDFPTHGIGPIKGSVIVRNKKTGAERAYRTGQGTAWVVEFHDDLHADKYD